MLADDFKLLKILNAFCLQFFRFLFQLFTINVAIKALGLEALVAGNDSARHLQMLYYILYFVLTQILVVAFFSGGRFQKDMNTSFFQMKLSCYTHSNNQRRNENRIVFCAMNLGHFDKKRQ